MLLCVALARSASGTNRAVFLGLAAGTLFGTSAVLTKAFVHYLGGGILNWVPHWEPYALAVSSITGLVLAQSAFQTGALAAAIGAEQVMQPLTGVALGVGLLDEHLGDLRVGRRRSRLLRRARRDVVRRADAGARRAPGARRSTHRARRRVARRGHRSHADV